LIGLVGLFAAGKFRRQVWVVFVVALAGTGLMIASGGVKFCRPNPVGSSTIYRYKRTNIDVVGFI
jgi:hypothetical protein